jgi:hypothetical protein
MNGRACVLLDAVTAFDATMLDRRLVIAWGHLGALRPRVVLATLPVRCWARVVASRTPAHSPSRLRGHRARDAI